MQNCTRLLSNMYVLRSSDALKRSQRHPPCDCNVFTSFHMDLSRYFRNYYSMIWPNLANPACNFSCLTLCFSLMWSEKHELKGKYGCCCGWPFQPRVDLLGFKDYTSLQRVSGLAPKNRGLQHRSRIVSNRYLLAIGQVPKKGPQDVIFLEVLSLFPWSLYTPSFAHFRCQKAKLGQEGSQRGIRQQMTDPL